jgi:hypothetical protein
MPLMFGAFSFVLPAGLTIYMFTNTVLSALHSIYMNKFDKQSLEIAERLKKNKDLAAAELTAKPSGLGGAAARAKDVAAKAKRVVDVKATAVSSDDADDDGDDTDEGTADAAGAPGPGAARNRPRRKKRKR